MKTVKEVYEESIEKINNAGAITEIASEIKKVTEALNKFELSKWSADQLSRALTKLAVLRVNLGAEMADAVAFHDISYTHRKIKYANEWKPTKDKLNKVMTRATVQDIDSVIIDKLKKEYQDEITQKHYAERLKVMYNATATLITSLQSRLGVLKQERSEARHA